MSKERVNHPDHYNAGGIECIDALGSATAGLDGIEAFDTANAIKYLWRWKHKNGVEDLKKAIWYIQHLIGVVTGEEDEISYRNSDHGFNYLNVYLGNEEFGCEIGADVPNDADLKDLVIGVLTGILREADDESN